MKKGRHYSREEIEIISKSAIGKTFNDLKDEEIITIDEDGKINKGGFGQLIETYLFGIDTNSESEPDFIDAGVELKVTPYKRNKNNSLSAKERLVLNIIDYNTEFANEFKSSHFWYKNNKLQIIWYLWEENKDKLDYIITHEKFMDLSLSEDLKQIEEDYYTIVNKIKDGKAHELSEADTMYLGACTKGANADSLRTQPFNEIKARQRAFCFKNSYMNSLVRKYIGNYSDVEKILNDNTTISEFIKSVVDKHKGKTRTELMKEFNIESPAKNINNMIICRMFGVKGNLSETEEFAKANIIPRTIRVEENGRIIESMPFPAFKYTDILSQKWETSDFREELETTKYMFFVFKKEANDYVFKGIKLWNMPETDIQVEAKHVWKLTQMYIMLGKIVKNIDNKGNRTTYFPGMSTSRVCHVRPHARNSKDTFKLPVPDELTGLTEYTKHCFWINNTYLREILSDML